MPLSQSESGLSAPNYAYIQAAEQYPAFSLIAHRYSPAFSSCNGNANDMSAWDGGDIIYYLTQVNTYKDWRVNKYVISTDTTSSLLTTVFSASYNDMGQYIHPSISIGSNGKIYIWWFKTLGNVAFAAYNTDGSVFTAPTTIVDRTINQPVYDWFKWIYDYVLFSKLPSQSTWKPPVFTGSTVKNNNTADLAFDASDATYWEATTNTGILTVDLSLTHLTALDFGLSYHITGMTTTAPKNWTVQTSPDGSAWTTVDTQTNQTSWGATAPVKNSYTFASPVSALYVRLNVTAANGGATLRVYDFDLHVNPIPFTALPSTVLFAGCGSDTCYVVYYSSTQNAYVVEKMYFTGGSWTTLPNMIIPDRPEGLAAVRLPDGSDFVVVSTPYTGKPGVTTINGTTRQYRRANVGLLGFISKGSTWSPVHTVIDSDLGKYQDTEFGSVSLSYANGTIFLYAYAYVNGQKMRLLYTSQDGTTWTGGQQLTIPAASSNDLTMPRLLVTPNYVFAGTYRAPVTLMFGASAAANQLDLTARAGQLSGGFDASMSPMKQAAITLDNSDGALTGHAWFNADNVVLIRQQIGYQPVTGTEPTPGGTPVLVSFGDIFVETYEYDTNPQNQVVNITGRDILSWMSDVVRARHAYYFDSQLIGADTYSDTIDDNSGGLAHTFIQSMTGKIETVNDNLVHTPATTGRANSMMFSTFEDDLWNGSISFGFKTHDNTASVVGLIFRGRDKDNFYSVEYRSASGVDRIALVLYKNGVKTDIVSGGSTMGWRTTSVTALHYIRVDFIYQSIYIYISTDNITWTLYTSILMTNVRDNVGFVRGLSSYDAGVTRNLERANLQRSINNVPNQSGYVGIISF